MRSGQLSRWSGRSQRFCDNDCCGKDTTISSLSACVFFLNVRREHRIEALQSVPDPAQPGIKRPRFEFSQLWVENQCDSPLCPNALRRGQASASAPEALRAKLAVFQADAWKTRTCKYKYNIFLMMVFCLQKSYPSFRGGGLRIRIGICVKCEQS